MLLAQAERRLDITDQLARGFPDERDAGRCPADVSNVCRGRVPANGRNQRIGAFSEYARWPVDGDPALR